MTVITPDLLRSLVIECVRKIHPPSRHTNAYEVEFLFRDVAELAKKRGLEYQEGMSAWHDNRHNPVSIHENLRQPIWDIAWDLIIEGILRPGDRYQGFALPRIHVTEFGKEALKGAITPYDPEGYLRHLIEKVPTADEVIVRYVSESAATLRQNCLLSSTVMLGGASEHAFLMLLEAFQAALNPVDQAALAKTLEKMRSVKLQHEEFMKWYERKLKALLKPDFGSDWLSETESALDFVLTYFRKNRNAAGHPSDARFSREMSAAHLVMFPTYLRSLYDLIEWLDSHKPL